MGVDTIEPIAINGVIVDFAAEILRDRTGRRLELRPQSFAVLRYLAANAGRLVTKDELAAAVWPGLAVTDDSLVQCVHEIRRALGDATHAVIRTVPRRGYRFAPSIAAETGSPRRLARLILLAGVAAMALVINRILASYNYLKLLNGEYMTFPVIVLESFGDMNILPFNVPNLFLPLTNSSKCPTSEVLQVFQIRYLVFRLLEKLAEMQG